MRKEQQMGYYLKPLIKGYEIKPNITHVQMQEIANSIIEPVENGNKDTIKALEELKAWSNILKKAIDRVEELAIDGVLDKEIPAYFSKQIKLSNGRKTYDYSNSECIVMLEKKLNDLKKQASLIKKETHLTDADTGETLTLKPAIQKIGKTSLIINFEK